MRKLTTIILSLVMLISLAAPALAYDGTWTGDGKITYTELDDEIKLVLPTALSLNFALDPQGLTSLAIGESMTFEELLASGNAGKIIFNMAALPVIINESAFDVDVNFTAGITTDNQDSGTDDIAVTTNRGAVFNSTTQNNNVYIGVSASVEPISKGTDNSGFYVDPSEFDGYMELPVPATSANPGFTFDLAEWQVERVAETTWLHKLTPETGSGIALSFSGLCNPYADWSAYMPTLSPAVAAVFTYTDLASTVSTMSANDTIEILGTVATFGTDFDSAAALVAFLNDDVTGADYIWSVDNDDILATAKVAGEVGSDGPAAGPGDAALVISGASSSVTSDETTEGDDGGEVVVASKGLGINFVINAVESAAPGTPNAAEVYGLKDGTTWVDVFTGDNGAIRNALKTQFTAVSDALEAFAEADAPATSEAAALRTALGVTGSAWSAGPLAAKLAYDNAKNALDTRPGSPDALFVDAYNALVGVMINALGALELDDLIEDIEGETSGIIRGFTGRTFFASGGDASTAVTSSSATQININIAKAGSGAYFVEFELAGAATNDVKMYFTSGTEVASTEYRIRADGTGAGASASTGIGTIELTAARMASLRSQAVGATTTYTFKVDGDSTEYKLVIKLV